MAGIYEYRSIPTSARGIHSSSRRRTEETSEMLPAACASADKFGRVILPNFHGPLKAGVETCMGWPKKRAVSGK